MMYEQVSCHISSRVAVPHGTIARRLRREADCGNDLARQVLWSRGTLLLLWQQTWSPRECAPSRQRRENGPGHPQGDTLTATGPKAVILAHHASWKRNGGQVE